MSETGAREARSEVSSEMLKRLEQARSASRMLRNAESAAKNQVLFRLGELIIDREPQILEANSRDLSSLSPDTTAAFRDRLTLSRTRLLQMGESLRQVAALADPVGEEVSSRTLTNGLCARQVRSPLGVILMIFESRPNVALEAFSLAFKSGNVIILRGGKESRCTVAVLYELMTQALEQVGFPTDCVIGLTDPERSLVQGLLGQPRWIDVVVPRGGDSLIEFVTHHSLIPIIKNDRGLCHVYVHSDADPSMAEEIVFNAKTQRPGVCNAMETLLVHSDIASSFLPRLYSRLETRGVSWQACVRTQAILAGRPHVDPAMADTFDTEHLDLVMGCRIVDSLDEAIAHIERHGSRHSEAIVTSSEKDARRFESEVDSAAVYWNASTRFTDGFELGLGGELGISTQKLHVRGPVGLRELTSVRWIIEGVGQVRK